jgi:hypothetical protein
MASTRPCTQSVVTARAHSGRCGGVLAAGTVSARWPWGLHLRLEPGVGVTLIKVLAAGAHCTVGAMGRRQKELRRRCLMVAMVLRCTLVAGVGSYSTRGARWRLGARPIGQRKLGGGAHRRGGGGGASSMVATLWWSSAAATTSYSTRVEGGKWGVVRSK